MFNWDDLKIFMAVVRDSSCALAAKRLAINQSTVSRRITALEDAFGTRLFQRTAKGLVLKPRFGEVMSLAESMEAAALQIERVLAGPKNRMEGVVRVATIEEIATLFLVPGLPYFRKQWPGIKIDLLTGTRTLDLTRGEADVSLRLARPTQGELYARKVGGFGYGIYAAEDYLRRVPDERQSEPERLDWVILDEEGTHHPEHGWFRKKIPKLEPVLRCSSLKTEIAAVLAGLGVAMLPRPMARLHEGLKRLPIDTGDLYREIWLVVHSDLHGSFVIQTVMDFLRDAINRPLEPSGSRPEY